MWKSSKREINVPDTQGCCLEVLRNKLLDQQQVKKKKEIYRNRKIHLEKQRNTAYKSIKS